MTTSALEPIEDDRLSVRPIATTDADRLVAFHEALDDESHYFRFFNFHPHLTADEVIRFTNVDHRRREALVVLEADRIVAVGRYDEVRDDPTTAEVAFVVALDHRHEGLASRLLHELARRAADAGFEALLGETLNENTRMRSVFRHAGFPTTNTFEDGIVHTRMEIGRTRAR
jgi:RimJ/RimL family protein N-acetyltransferase